MTELVRLSINITSGPETCVVSSPVFRQGSVGKKFWKRFNVCNIDSPCNDLLHSVFEESKVGYEQPLLIKQKGLLLHRKGKPE